MYKWAYKDARKTKHITITDTEEKEYNNT